MNQSNHQEAAYRDAVRAVDDARQELIRLTGRFAELDVPLRAALRDRYTLTFGALRIREEKLQLEDLRLRLRLEAIREAIAKGAAVDRKGIEAEVHRRTGEAAAAILRSEANLARARKEQRMAGFLEGQAKEHVRLIRDIVGKLHPQLYPGQGEEKNALFVEARSAFEEGNIARLQMLHAMSRQIPMPAIHGSILELNEETLRLEELAREMRARLQLVTQEFPFTKEEILEDEAKTEQEEKRIRQRLMDLQQSIAYHRRIAAELLSRPPGNGQTG